jgi:probable F420-dependent oxidoreductase
VLFLGENMKVDAGITWDLNKAGAEAKELEEMGYSGLKSAETSHDPFLPLVVAAQTTSSIDLVTGIAVAFGRSPMTVANLGHDLNAASKGRFILGLGSQIRPHITKRYSMPWSAPAARMREYIMAMHAIWASWHEGKPLEFLGKFYTHTLMTPFFTPTNIEYGPPKVYLAAVGPLMTEVAGEVADGLLVHGFTTEAYLRQTTLPALERGFAKSGRSRKDFEISYPVFSVTGRDEKEVAASATKMRQQVAFYGSTPAYKPVLDSIGVGDLQPELNAMSKQGRWEEMGELIDPGVLEKFAVSGEPKMLATQIKQRYGDIVDRTSASYATLDHAQRLEFIEALRVS